MEVRGAEVMVTGASGGLGEAIARDLARRGPRVVLTARRTASIEALADQLGGEAVTADLTDRDDVARLAERAGALDVLVANAGVGADEPPSTLATVAPDLTARVMRAVDVGGRVGT